MEAAILCVTWQTSRGSSIGGRKRVPGKTSLTVINKRFVLFYVFKITTDMDSVTEDTSGLVTELNDVARDYGSYLSVDASKEVKISYY